MILKKLNSVMFSIHALMRKMYCSQNEKNFVLWYIIVENLESKHGRVHFRLVEIIIFA